MADRVFPNNNNVDMGSKIEFNGIDWAKVEHSLTNRTASDYDGELAALVFKLKSEIPELDSVPAKEIKDTIENDVEDLAEDKEPQSPMDDEQDDEMLLSFTNNKPMKKIAFTHPSQISAEAIEKAIAAGDEHLVKVILNARKANRQRIAAAIEQKFKKEAEALSKYTKFAEENDEKPDNWDEMTASEQKSYNSEHGTNYPVKNDDSSGVDDSDGVGVGDGDGDDDGDGENVSAFTSPSKFTQAQRDSFIKAAMKQGFPKEYIEAMVQPVVSEKVYNLVKDIESVYSSNLSKNIKNSSIKSLIKEAKLNADSKKKFIEYWNNILGYQDKEFWPDVAKDYAPEKTDK